MPFQPGSPKSADEATKNWTEGASAKAEKWKDRTLKPRELFTHAAKRQVGHWLARVTESGTAGMTAGLNRAEARIDEIANNIATHGPTAFRAGITKGHGKMQRAMASLLPAIHSAVGKLGPRGSIDENIARSADFQRAMAKEKGKHRG